MIRNPRSTVVGFYLISWRNIYIPLLNDWHDNIVFYELTMCHYRSNTNVTEEQRSCIFISVKSILEFWWLRSGFNSLNLYNLSLFVNNLCLLNTQHPCKMGRATYFLCEPGELTVVKGSIGQAWVICCQVLCQTGTGCFQVSCVSLAISNSAESHALWTEMFFSQACLADVTE